MTDATINCQRCGGPTKGQNVFKGNHRHFPDCIAFLLKYISELEPRAAFGDQCYQDRCENAYVEQTIVKRLDYEIARLMDGQRVDRTTVDQLRIGIGSLVDALEICYHGVAEGTEQSHAVVEAALSYGKRVRVGLDSGTTVSKLAKYRAALRRIAFWLPTVCYEHDDRRYCDIEDVYAMKRIAADARAEVV